MAAMAVTSSAAVVARGPSRSAAHTSGGSTANISG